MKEFELIEKITAIFPQKADIGIGDDTAAVKTDNGYLLFTVDTITANTHYRKSWEKKFKKLYFSLGWKLLAISVSDVASMGGVPEFALLSFCLEKNFSQEKVLELSKGLSKAASRYGVSIIGGDTVKGDSEVFSLTLTGKAYALMTRDCAVPGDLVGVIGTPGDAAGGLYLIENRNPPFSEEEERLLKKFFFPEPSPETGKLLVKIGVKCCIDNSDGLLFSLYLISEKSKVALNVDKDKIPVSRELKRLFGEKAEVLALTGGEDYNLIFTFPENLKEKVEKIPSVSIIGRVESGEGVYLNGEKVEPTGFDHFGGA
ncbi:thiamine-phosphate kinase [Desulfurobacterium atlanticum]|uniref:Thiamine-monophosphate kinase n=1 Tax=Desulfurobacterium atlanticum TaxID=240169 RepID=A0A238XP27_9BACT|nr:thiamine-phosphate kinase [Desulfurobacterium atlanticum]SNR60432.1 thiamine-phosphate kinase [Desulfurobacterium atlanticum]